MIHSFEDKTPRVAPSAYVSWNAEVAGDVELAEDASVWYAAVLRGDIAGIRIGRSSNVQDGCVIHVDIGVPCIVGEGVTLGHRVVLHGCTIGDWCLIGMGAVILNGAVVGEGSIVGAGALVTQGKTFPPRSLIMGSPARVVRELRDDEVAELREHALAYVDLARRTARGTLQVQASI
jgi:carbonic anhydrase/acetyltransferase-like protein (isoleucine patch superfamily)